MPICVFCDEATAGGVTVTAGVAAPVAPRIALLRAASVAANWTSRPSWLVTMSLTVPSTHLNCALRTPWFRSRAITWVSARTPSGSSVIATFSGLPGCLVKRSSGWMPARVRTRRYSAKVTTSGVAAICSARARTGSRSAATIGAVWRLSTAVASCRPSVRAILIAASVAASSRVTPSLSGRTA